MSNPIKPEPSASSSSSAAPPARLGSLRQNPDLTLGGVQKAKFTPNLSVQRARKPTGNDSVESLLASAASKDSQQPRGPRGPGAGDRPPFQKREFKREGGPNRPGFAAAAKTPQQPVMISRSLDEPSSSSSPRSSSPDSNNQAAAPPSSSADMSIDDRAAPNNPKKSKKKSLLDHESDIWPVEAGDHVPVTLEWEDYDHNVEAEENEADEENNKLDIFDDFSGKLIEDQLFFMQLPSVLPNAIFQNNNPSSSSAPGVKPEPGSSSAPPLPPKPALSNSIDDLYTAEFDNSLTNLPTGYIGKLMVMKSGKIKMQLGNVLLDVTPATETTFAQHVVALSPESGNCFDLGPVANRILCMPDIDFLLKKELSEIEEQQKQRTYASGSAYEDADM